MKKKTYLYICILFIVAGIAVLIYSVSTTGLFEKNKIIVKALPCTDCAGYHVILGSFKLPSHLTDTIKRIDDSKIFLTGVPSPYASDFTRTYDYYMISWKETGLNKKSESGEWHAVIAATAWQHYSFSSIGPMVLLSVLLMMISRRFYRKYKKANKNEDLERDLIAY